MTWLFIVWMRALWEIYLSTIDSLEQLILGIAFEWLNTEHDCVENNSCCPVIGRRTRVFLIVAQFRRHECWGSTECPQLLIWVFRLRSETKVYDLCGLLTTLIVNQNIFEFDIAMANVSTMIIVHSMNKLIEYLSAFPFWKALAWYIPWKVSLVTDHYVEHLSFTWFKYQEQLLTCLHSIIKFHDAWMTAFCRQKVPFYGALKSFVGIVIY